MWASKESGRITFCGHRAEPKTRAPKTDLHHIENLGMWIMLRQGFLAM